MPGQQQRVLAFILPEVAYGCGRYPVSAEEFSIIVEIEPKIHLVPRKDRPLWRELREEAYRVYMRGIKREILDIPEPAPAPRAKLDFSTKGKK